MTAMLDQRVPASVLDLSGLQADLTERFAALKDPDRRGAWRDVGLAAWVDLIGDSQRLMNTVAAIQSMAMAQAASIEIVDNDDGTTGERHHVLGHREIDAPSVMAPLLGLTTAGAETRVAEACGFTTTMPALLEAMGAGDLDRNRAARIAGELSDATPETQELVSRAVVTEAGPDLSSRTAGRLRNRTRVLLSRLDPKVIAERAEFARERRGLTWWVEEAGVDEWHATLPVEDSRPLKLAIDGIARRLRSEGKCVTLAQGRADALVLLASGHITTHVDIAVTVPASAVAALGETIAATERTVAGWTDVRGLGSAHPTSVPNGWLARLIASAGREADGGSSSSVSAKACHPLSGALLSSGLSTDAYTPTARIRAAVKARDQHCRFPDCTTRAEFCDLDHAVSWPVGATEPENLYCLCRRHHRIKQLHRWFVRALGAGALEWTDPVGRVRYTHPVDHLGVGAAIAVGEKALAVVAPLSDDAATAISDAAIANAASAVEILAPVAMAAAEATANAARKARNSWKFDDEVEPSALIEHLRHQLLAGGAGPPCELGLSDRHHRACIHTTGRFSWVDPDHKPPKRPWHEPLKNCDMVFARSNHRFLVDLPDRGHHLPF